ncbi:anhydro-N-acetylmuramic acid kinase [Ideonella azotifigens]|uniref:Anhydro-N-acetylmuramic acid kinase n=2 Tax=Ideonella azotifigens TaxID=513160 RepID=A0ABP3VZH0_9BURK|nr:anhydro-N-acetylmuramic acid kinase [Ideonella azotifigens]MCD2343381.1 anhydro-N-acetylmuramic acid kinase [Ideonella azotifigens]
MDNADLYIGLMSGTSLDGIDGVLAAFERESATMQVLAHAHAPFPTVLREELLALNQRGADELHRAALAANALATLQAGVVQQLLRQHGCRAHQVIAVGSHGQTVRHRPGEFDGLGYTLQLNQGALLAERCGIDVVCDFRSRDVAAGGQGAPLVPAFHAMVFGGTERPRAVLNLGGIANLTLLPGSRDPATPVRGFDCGPGNALLDHWAQMHLGQAYDEAGRWSAGGQVQPELLARLLAEPFLAAPPPKSTGRDLFNASWLMRQLAGLGKAAALPAPQDVQATLAEFTAQSTAQALLQHAPASADLLVCGGGALNDDLMRRLSAALPGVMVNSSDDAGLPPLQVEAAAFAWLARAFMQRRPGNRAEVTGARGPRVLGALYPAG